MSYYDRDSSRPETRRQAAPKAAAGWSNKLLGNAQKAKLSIAARHAWVIQSEAGLVDGDFDAWRHAQTKVACGQESLRAATNSHFRSILAHFLRLSGQTSEADKIWRRTGRVAGSDQVHDTHENRETARALIRDLIAASHGRLNEAYIAPLIRDRFGNKTQYDLTALDLQQLLYTLKARLRKMIPR